jgi:hypothetical protein
MEPEGSSPCSQELATCPYPEPNESNPHPQTLSLRSILMLSSYPCLGLPSGLLPSGFPTKMYAPLVSPMRATCLTHLILLALITLTIPKHCYIMQIIFTSLDIPDKSISLETSRHAASFFLLFA